MKRQMLMVAGLWLMAAGWAPAAGYKMQITLPGYTNRTEVLTNFPVLVVLSNNIGGSGFDFATVLSTNGQDLRFRDATDTTALDYDIESWDTNTASYVWVRMPTLTNNGTGSIWARWGDGGDADPLPCLTNGATWSNGFRSVYHFAETAGDARDSSPNRNTATNNNITYGPGQVGNSALVDSETDFYRTPPVTNSTLSLSVWYYYGNLGTDSGWNTLFCRYSGGYHHLLIQDSTRKVGTYNSGPGFISAPNVTLSLGSWYFFTVTMSGTTYNLYVNGEHVLTNATSFNNTTYNMSIISTYNGTMQQAAMGQLDEARVEDVIRSTNWIWACWMNQASNEIFSSYGSVQPDIPGSPQISSVGATNILTTAADLVGNLTTGDAPVTVLCYWGTNDGGAVSSQWMTNTDLGVQAWGYVTNSLTGLAESTRYYFRFHATNSLGEAWAGSSVLFSTLGLPAVDNDSGATSIGQTSARLRGTLQAGNPSPDVWIYWGTSDGTTNAGDWDQPALPVGQPGLTDFGADVTGLQANRQYWYRCLASNDYGAAWAAASTNFTTAAPTVSIGPAGTEPLEGALGTTNSVVFTVTLSATSAVAVSVNYDTANGTATAADNDYVPLSSVLTIPAGLVTSQITVQVIGDNLVEPNETFTLTLSSPSGATLGTPIQGTVTNINDDFDYYVRGDGLGSDAYAGTTWGTAWATLQKVLNTVSGPGSSAGSPWIVNVQASSGSQAYHSAQVTRNYYNMYINYEGGWENVDAAPVQTGRSRIMDTNSVPPNEPGLAMQPTGSSFNQTLFMGLNRFDITNVTYGIRLYIPGNLSYDTLQLTLTDSTIAAGTTGVYVVHGGNGSAGRLLASNVVIRGGIDGPGDGIFLGGRPDGSIIQNAQITSAAGRGIYDDVRCSSGGWGPGFTMTIRDTDISGCASDGVYLVDATYAHYNTTSYIYLDRLKIMNNGGYGVYRRHDDGNGSSTCQLRVTNCVISSNALDGVYLRGEDLFGGDAGKGGRFDAQFVNVTLATNSGDGLRLLSRHTSGGNTVGLYNTIVSGCGTDGLYLDDNRAASGPTLTEAYNDFFGNAGTNLVRVGTGGTNYPALDANDLQLDPGFYGKGPDPFRLRSTSALNDAASATYAPDVDVLNDPRPEGPADAMGAYETSIVVNAPTIFRFR